MHLLSIFRPLLLSFYLVVRVDVRGASGCVYVNDVDSSKWIPPSRQGISTVNEWLNE